MLAFRAHVHRAGSRWTWKVSQGRAGASTTRSGTADTRAAATRAAIRAALRPAPAQVQLPTTAPAALAA